MGFQHRDAKARAKKRNIQRHRDRRYNAQMLWADIECKKQRDAANNKNDDIDGKAIGILRINPGHDQAEGPEYKLDCRPENRGFPVVLQDVLPDLFIAILDDASKQQFIFYL